MAYRPEPIDTSQVQLGSELSQLLERLARNNHELWARQRMAEGWRWGPRRDDAARETPCLVPYDELPESEKEYDRVMAREALKCVLALGGTVAVPKSQDAGDQPALAAYRERVARANGEGECLTACDIADEGLRQYPGDPRLLEGRALALARMGSHQEARRILEGLAGTRNDEETLGLLARTYKDLWLESGDPADLERAWHAYSSAYAAHPERYWTGINAATLAAAKGDRDTATAAARAVRDVCLARLGAAAEPERYWLTGTVAEAALVLGEDGEAAARYADASALARSDLGSLASTLRNARILLRTAPAETAARIEHAIGMPNVAVFSGHMPDAPGRARPRFPEASMSAVQETLRARLLEANVRIGYASAAAGADLLFLEAVADSGGRTHIVLPSRHDQFIEESVAPWGAAWVERFERAVARTSEVLVASEERLTIGSVAYEYAHQVLHGLAAARARQLGVDLVRMAVWDGCPPERAAGAADAVGRWRAAGHPVMVVDPAGGGSRTVAPDPSAPVYRGVPGGERPTAIRSMIFADAYHFSQLGEAQMPGFVEGFLGPVAGMMARTHPAPLFRNTWGDGLFFVFERASEAGRFAIDLAECVNRIDRRAAGLPESMHLRVALHVGPVYPFQDRIIGQSNYIGSHVNRAARIEPVTPPGQVYGTYAFVALAALEAPGRFRCDYVGRIPLAKGFGEFPMYRVRGGLA